METSISQWGNSLGLRIPRELVKSLRLREGTKVELSVESEILKIVPKKRKPAPAKLDKRLDLRRLMARVKPDNLPDASDFETLPLGREVW